MLAEPSPTEPPGRPSGTVRTTARLGRLRVVTVDGDPSPAPWTARTIAQGDDEYLIVMLLDGGAADVEQDGREIRLPPGGIVLCDSVRPSRITFHQPSRATALVLPRRLVGPREPGLQRLTATAIGPDTLLGSLLPPLLARLADTAAACPPGTGEALARSTVDLLAVLIEARTAGEAADAPTAAQAWLARIQAHIDRHLADPGLTPEAVAAAHQISVRYLHRLFQAEGTTVGRWIRRRRLEECRRELARRDAADRTVAAVARRWGFTNATHFSRVFRAAYGLSPGEWRDSALPKPRTPAALARGERAMPRATAAASGRQTRDEAA
ncbi:helix-turn-helix domain-containing protein [Streptomyces sp. NPDC048193]|uniref:helix-turn-helix domain-containing protein n=1 Tax=unclassified Streptomyces TaxID=2593676 RepID=UPI00342850DF